MLLPKTTSIVPISTLLWPGMIIFSAPKCWIITKTSPCGDVKSCNLHGTLCGSSSSGRATASQAVGGRFEPGLPLRSDKQMFIAFFVNRCIPLLLLNFYYQVVPVRSRTTEVY